MDRWETFKEIEMDKIRIFPVIKREYNIVPNMDHIHPLKQQQVYELYNSISALNSRAIKRIWIFGSSTNNSCNIRSDIDVLIEVADMVSLDSEAGEEFQCSLHHILVKSLGTDFDLIFMNDLDQDKQLYKNILKTRRLIYERHD